jgi:CDP-paratose 2-epimerase
MYDRVLVTGGAGFVGSSLAMALKLARPARQVISFDNLHRRGSELNLPRLAEAGVEFIRGDVRDPEDLNKLPFEPDLILECSAEPSAQAGYGGSPEYVIRTNLIGVFHCLELARCTGAAFVFLSSSRVYPHGHVNRLAFREGERRFHLLAEQSEPGASEAGIAENFPLDGPRSIYGMTKLAAELMIQEYGDAYGLRYVIDRCGLIAGFGGTGKQVRDVLHIDDLRDLLLLQIGNFAHYDRGLFNVGGGAERSLSLLECTELCREITGNSVEIASEPAERPADVRIFLTDHRSISQRSGWQPRREPRTTLADVYAWLRRHEPDLKGPLLGAP